MIKGNSGSYVLSKTLKARPFFGTTEVGTF